MDYDLEEERIIETIRKKGLKRVCLQLPDGLKPYAGELSSRISRKTGATVFLWMGSVFGACDVPPPLDSFKIELLVQFGHSDWK